MKKGMLTVIIITLIAVFFITLQAVGVIAGIMEGAAPSIIFILVLAIILALIGALIYNAYERIKEIKEEDKDDLSKY